MSGVAYPSEAFGARARSGADLTVVRVVGGVSVRFRPSGARTVADDLMQRGGYRLAFPDTFAAHLEAAQVNTGGGVAGGDRVATRVMVERGADAVFTTQAADRIYRSSGAPAQLEVALTLADGARLDWLPQQTIVYAGASMRRRIDIDMASGSRLLIAEMLTFGRPASGEGAAPASIRDRWRVRRDGRLVLAEDFRLEGEMRGLMARAAMGGSAHASALVAYLAPGAADRRDAARAAVAQMRCEAGVSTWNGLLVARLLGATAADCVAAVAGLAQTLAGRAMPRVWSL